MASFTNKTASIHDYVDARCSIAGLLSEIAFGSADPRDLVAPAAHALSVMTGFRRGRKPTRG